ncbi:hypothetical protein [Actinomycetospora sp. CA-053990]|uniref:hypothetical protein n=1 Tax=Actinomycetospora sp. CA-053990 TaxID=3239891 RepID=UPI003D93845F
MRLGTTLPQFGNVLDEADRIGEFAEMAEDAGVDSLWVGDRLLAADELMINGDFARVEAANRAFAATPSARRASPRTRSGGRSTARRPRAA